MVFKIDFNPALPENVLWIWAISSALLFLFSIRAGYTKAFLRLAVAAFFLLLMLNPQNVEEQRQSLNDIVLVAVDKSQSQSVLNRTITREAALKKLTEHLRGTKNLDVRVIPVAANAASQTETFKDIEAGLRNIPAAQRAGVILLTDGQISDSPTAALKNSGPFHVLLTGSKEEFDRKVVIDQAPAYGLLGQDVQIEYHVEEKGRIKSEAATIAISAPEGPPVTKEIRPGEKNTFDFKLNNRGRNEVLLTLAPIKNEITAANNQALISVESVSERLRVLLVAGEPYPGGRMWRDLLTGDPGIDLIHFTILRGPEQIDQTPREDLSLIAFPFEELFERKLNQFDLVIMDRFALNAALPDFYFNNLKNYVLQGGALLVTTGPSYNTPNSLFYTALGDILPAMPRDALVRKSYKPQITQAGLTHPVTGALASQESWGNWLEYMPLQKLKGETLMTADDQPLLILSHEGQGRVAQLASDQIWLWARGYDGGGPYTEFLKRSIHWLMKEPALDENAININSSDNGNNVTLRLRFGDNQTRSLNLTAPDGQSSSIDLVQQNDGWLTADLKNLPRGVYKIEHAKQTRLMTIGEALTPEFTDLMTTEAKLRPLVQETSGKMIWLEDDPTPNLKLRRNEASSVTSSSSKNLLPPFMILLLLLPLLILMWWRESRYNNINAWKQL